MGLSTRFSIAAKQRNRIRQAYEVAQSRLGNSQADIRQGTTEGLNARGILNGGASVARGANDRFDTEGRIGETGAANTLGGQTERDLSTEFALERRDLWNQRQDAIANNKGQVKQDAINAGVGAAQTIASAFMGAQGGGASAGAMAARAPGVMAQRSYGTSGGPLDPSQMQGPIASGGIRGAFGLSPVDGSGTPQIGVAQPGMDSFNFHL